MGSALLNRWTDPLYSPVRGKFIFRLGAYGKSTVPLDIMESKQVRLPSDRQRTAAQLEKKNVKEELLKLDTKQVYDEQMKEQLDQALSYEYPYLEDTGLYTQMSVSELKKQSQIGREEENIGTERKDLSEVRLDHEYEMEPESSEAEDGKKQIETGKKGCIQRNGLSPCLRMSGSACCYRPEKTGRGSVRPVSARLSYRRSL